MGMFGNDRYDSSLSKGSYFDWSKCISGAPKFYKTEKSGEGGIDIIPYYITSNKHPMVVSGKVKIGQPDYNLDFYIHKNVGAANTSVVCPKKTYGKPCPICDEMEVVKKAKGWDSDECKALNPSRRVIYNIFNAKVDGFVPLVFDVSHFLFEKEMIEKNKVLAQRQGLTYLPFAEAVGGYTIFFRTTTEKKGGFETTIFKDFEFQKRDFDITKEMMDKAIDFSALLIVKSYEELKALFYGGPEESVVEETSQRSAFHEEVRTRTAIPSEEVVRSTSSEPQTVRRNSETPTRQSSPVESQTSSLTCPSGYMFGRDNDKKPECDNCSIWDKCRAAKSR